MMERTALGHSPVDRLIFQLRRAEMRDPQAVFNDGLAALSRSSGFAPSLEQRVAMSQIFHERDELRSASGSINRQTPEQRLWSVIAETHDARYDASQMPVQDVPHAVKSQGLENLARESVEQVRLLHTAPTITLPVRDDLQLTIGYDNSQLEGIGGVFIYLQDEQTREQPIPAFVLRGNPGVSESGKLVFSTRAVQPWISEQAPSIPEAKSEITARRNFARDEVQAADTILEKIAGSSKFFRRFNRSLRTLEQETIVRRDWAQNAQQAADVVLDIERQRSRLVRRLSRALQMKTENVTPMLSFIYTLSMAYLHTQGVTEFRGIAHNMHPEVVSVWSDMGNFNFDTFWDHLGLLKEQNGDNIHPWVQRSEQDSLVTAQNLPMGALAAKLISDIQQI